MADFSQLDTVNNSGTPLEIDPIACDSRVSRHPWFRRPNVAAEQRLPKEPAVAGNTFLYVIQSLHLIKIGHAKNLYIRMSNLRVDNPHDAKLLHYVEVEREAARIAEAWTHFHFSERCVSGEWFEVGPEEALAALDKTIRAKYRYRPSLR